MNKYFDIGYHYDSITDGWRYIFGENFHFGYFKTPEDDLNRATDSLIDELAALGNLGPETKILDAGCGIGSPAIYLCDKFSSDITGISTSKEGINIANSRIQGNKYQGKIRFMVEDMVTTGFHERSFDVIWLMESSHLIKNKKVLFDECYRLLKPGGNILLSDIILRKEINTIIRLRNIFRLINLLKTFGRGRLETIEYYTCLLHESGFKKVFSKKIGNEVEGTLNWWETNIVKNRSNLIKIMDEKSIMRFEKAIENFRYFFRENLFCYCLLNAEK